MTVDKPILVSLMAGLIGATIAAATGRENTRLENTLIGGLFTGFAAFRDPRASTGMTLVVAAAEGAIWGLTDRTTPMIKDWILPPAELPATTTA